MKNSGIILSVALIASAILMTICLSMNHWTFMDGEKPGWMGFMEIANIFLLIWTSYRCTKNLFAKPKNDVVEMFVEAFKDLVNSVINNAIFCVIVIEVAYLFIPDNIDFFNKNWLLFCILFSTMLLYVRMLVMTRKVEKAVENFDENVTDKDIVRFIKSLK